MMHFSALIIRLEQFFKHKSCMNESWHSFKKSYNRKPNKKFKFDISTIDLFEPNIVIFL